jgi:hypothetical protein
MKFFKKKSVIFLILLIVILIIVFGINQVLFLQKAHSTFENYYDFRGCRELVKKTTNYGQCRLGSGQIIKIVEYKGAWYLDGDLPCGPFCF